MNLGFLKLLKSRLTGLDPSGVAYKLLSYMPRPLFTYIRHPAAVPKLPRYLNNYKRLFHGGAEENHLRHS